MSCFKRCCVKFSQDFKEFVIQGNILDLAIGIVVGTAFTAVVQSLVDDMITPPLGFVIGGVDFSNLTIQMKNFVYQDQPPVVVRYGRFIQSIITLLIVAFILFFIVKGVNRLNKKSRHKKENDETESNIEANEDIRLLREIRDLLAGQLHTTRPPIRI